METKLTLRLRKSVIERAKAYAHHHRTSLSKLVENYLESVTKPACQEAGITPLVERLSGIIDLEDDLNLKEGYGDHLNEKHK